MSAADGLGPPVQILRPRKGIPSPGLLELFRRRELVLCLAGRDLRQRYSQTLLGVAWAVLQPLAQAVVFSLAFGRLLRVPSDSTPYEVFVFAGLLPWQLFASTIGRATSGMVASQALITRVAFPRLAIPAAALLAALVDLGVGLGLFLGYLAVIGRWPGWSLLLLPAALAGAIAVAFGAAAWLSALNARYRDVTHVVPFLLQLGMFVSPIIYPASLVPAGWRAVYALNPMVVVVEGFRAALVGSGGTEPRLLATSAVMLLTTSFAGVIYFRLRERGLADEL